MTPLDDTQYLFKNAHCFQELREIPKTQMKNKKMVNKMIIFNIQSKHYYIKKVFLYFIYMILSLRIL